MGADMHELVDAGQVGRLFTALALLLPPLCVAAGYWLGRRRSMARQWALYGLLIGLLGPLNWALWRVYNTITDAIGLDTVRNLAVNVALFIVVGALTGVVAGFAVRRIDSTVPGDRPGNEPE
jgi:hypothetical protein